MNTIYTAFKISCAYNSTTMARWAKTNNMTAQLVSIIINGRKTSRRVTQKVVDYIKATEQKFGVSLLPHQSNRPVK